MGLKRRIWEGVGPQPWLLLATRKTSDAAEATPMRTFWFVDRTLVDAIFAGFFQKRRQEVERERNVDFQHKCLQTKIQGTVQPIFCSCGSPLSAND